MRLAINFYQLLISWVVAVSLHGQSHVSVMWVYIKKGWYGEVCMPTKMSLCCHPVAIEYAASMNVAF